MKVRGLKNVVAILAVLIPGCGGEISKYEWLASESAPKGYPMQILSGSFYDDKGGGLYIPSRKKMHDGWGTEVSHHIVGDYKKLLPSRFDVLYFSYTENTFYGGDFNLPKEKINSLFANGYYSPKLDEQITYDMIVVGVAPGGFISVWLKGIDKTTEVFTGVVDKTDMPWENIISTKKYTREGFIERILEAEISQEGIDKIKKDGIPYGLWEKYRKRYHWTPVVTGVTMPKILDSISFYNGERDYFSKAYNNSWKDEPKAVPRSMHFVWKYNKDIIFSLGVDFDEDEIIPVFEKLSKKTNLPIEFNIHIEEAEGKLYYYFILRSGDEAIELKKGNYEHHRAAMTGIRLEKFLKDN